VEEGGLPGASWPITVDADAVAAVASRPTIARSAARLQARALGGRAAVLPDQLKKTMAAANSTLLPPGEGR
jgi:hypothetical protein